MSRRLELPEPIFSALEQAASASGTSPVGWIAAQLPHTPSELATGAKTLADLFLGRLGHVASGGKETLSENCGEKVADHLDELRRKGRM